MILLIHRKRRQLLLNRNKNIAFLQNHLDHIQYLHHLHVILLLPCIQSKEEVEIEIAVLLLTLQEIPLFNSKLLLASRFPRRRLLTILLVLEMNLTSGLIRVHCHLTLSWTQNLSKRLAIK